MFIKSATNKEGSFYAKKNQSKTIIVVIKINQIEGFCHGQIYSFK